MPINALLSFLAPIGIFLAIGALLDRVLGPDLVEKTDQKTGKPYLLVPTLRQQIGKMGSIFDLVFGRPLTSKFLLRTAVFSSVVFLLLIETRIDGGVRAYGGNWGRIVLLCCMVTSIAVDIVSLMITRVFLNSMKSNRRLGSLAVLFVADFFLSLRLAVFLGSILLGRVMYLVLVGVTPAAEPQPLTATLLISPTYTLEGEASYTAALSVSPEEVMIDQIDDIDGLGELTPSGLHFSAPPGVKVDLHSFFEEHSAIEADSISLILFGEDGAAYTESIAGIEYGWLESVELFRKGAETGRTFLIQTTGLRRPFSGVPWGVNLAASSRVFAEVERNFLPVIYLGGSGPRPIELVLPNAMGFTPFFSDRACLYGRTFTESETVNFSDCPEIIQIHSGISASLITNYFTDLSEFSSPRVPVAEMILSSMSFSAFAYIVVLILIVGRLAQLRAVRKLSPTRVLFWRSPFSLIGFLLGLAFAILTLAYS